MSRRGSWVRIVAIGAVLAIVDAGCSTAGSTPSAADSVSPAPRGSESPAASAPSSSTARLIVLADGVAGGMGLWSFDGSNWTVVGPTPGAAAMASTTGGLVVATGHDVDVRPASALGQPGTRMTIHWPTNAPTAPIAGLAASPTGKIALVTSDDRRLDYAVAGTDGAATSLKNAPTQTFTPIVAWLDETRILVLATDNLQISRLAVLDTVGGGLDIAKGTSGIRVFGLSGNRATVAAATDSSVYAGSLASFQGSGSPEVVSSLSPGQVVWALAMDAMGTHLFMLSGTMSPDGTVGSVHELGYARLGSTWTRVVDSPVPFNRGLGQACLT
jgi:hypothetical protein